MSREYGRGSIVSFIVVGVLLGALVLGGLYVVKNQLGGWLGDADQVAREVADEAVRESDEAANNGDDATSNDEQGADQNDAPVDDAADAPTRDRTDADRDNTAQPADDTETTPAVRDEATSGADEDTAMPTAGVELPQTGLADSLFAALPVVAVVAAYVAYRRSNML